MKLPSIRNMMPGRKRGMGTTAKMLLATLPVVAFVAGRMMSKNDNDEENW